ncbi:MAG: penicillin-binding protein, partial [Carnobacterium sp.]
GSTEVSFNESGGTTDQWTVGYTPDVVVATWMGFDQTDENHYMGTGSSTGVGPLFKLQMENVLPKTPQTPFGTQSAETIVQSKSEEQPQWKEDLKENVDYWSEQFKKGAENLKDKAGKLLDRLKDQ